MRKIWIFFILVLINLNSRAQNDSLNVLLPILSETSYQVLQQNNNLSASRILIDYSVTGWEKDIYNVSNTMRMQFNCPVMLSKKFNCAISARYQQNPAEGELLRKTARLILLTTDAQLKISPKLMLWGKASYFQRGDVNSFSNLISDQVILQGAGTWYLNSKFQISALFFMNTKYKETTTLMQTYPGLIFRWQPAENLKLMAGYPDLFGACWNIFKKLNIGFDIDKDLNTNAFINWQVTNSIGISLEYRQNNMDMNQNLFFEEESYALNLRDTIHYNNIRTLNKTIGLNFGFKTLKNTAVHLLFGYQPGSPIDIYMEKTKVYTDDVSDKLYAGITFISYFKH